MTSIDDELTPPTPGRRRIMQANRRRDTGPELALRSMLHRAGYRYRCDLRIDLASGHRVRPDIVFTRHRVVVFVDGCFWHVCPEHATYPAVNRAYWTPKLARNVARDEKNTSELLAAGWTVVRIWEHEAADAAFARVVEHLPPRPTRAEPSL